MPDLHTTARHVVIICLSLWLSGFMAANMCVSFLVLGMPWWGAVELCSTVALAGIAWKLITFLAQEYDNA